VTPPGGPHRRRLRRVAQVAVGAAALAAYSVRAPDLSAPDAVARRRAAEAPAAPDGLTPGLTGLTPDPAPLADWDVLRGLDPRTGVASPALARLRGRRVRVPGYVVPLDDARAEGAEFLLVPYYGACIHVPPPPANQMVLVRTPRPVRAALFDPVWVEGRLEVGLEQGAYGRVGFRLAGARVRPYTG